jgi:exopolysaccharide production protein ExoZ
MRKLESLQLGRAGAVLSVLLFHLSGLSREYLHGLFYYPWTQVLRAGVDVFFVISGVVMVVTTYGKLEQPGTGRRFLVHRVSRIYPPFLFLTMILTVFWMVRPAAVNSHHGGVDLFGSYTLWPSDKLPLVQVGWSLSFEMMFYLVFFCIITCASKRGLPRALILWSIIVLIGYAAIALDASGTLLRVFPRATFFFSPYVLEFIAGCFVGLSFLKRRLSGARTSALIAVALFTFEAALFQATNFNCGNSGALRVLLFGPPSGMLVYGLLAWEARQGSLQMPDWVIRCGDMSYSTYLVHLIVLHFAYRYSWRLFNHTGTRPLFLIFAAGLAMVASVIFYHTVERPFSLWTRLRLENLFEVQARAAAPQTVEGRSDALVVKD